MSDAASGGRGSEAAAVGSRNGLLHPRASVGGSSSGGDDGDGYEESTAGGPRCASCTVSRIIARRSSADMRGLKGFRSFRVWKNS